MKTQREILRSKNCFSVECSDSFSEYSLSFEDAVEACDEYAEQFRPRWIPVSERLPKGPDIVYLVAVKNKNKENGIPLIDIAVFDSDGIWQKSTVWEDVTHWMNLPEAP